MLAGAQGGGGGGGERRSREGEEAGRHDGGGASKKSSNGKASSKSRKKSQCKKCPRLIALMHELKNHLQILKPKADERDEYHVSHGELAQRELSPFSCIVAARSQRKYRSVQSSSKALAFHFFSARVFKIKSIFQKSPPAVVFSSCWLSLASRVPGGEEPSTTDRPALA